MSALALSFHTGKAPSALFIAPIIGSLAAYSVRRWGAQFFQGLSPQAALGFQVITTVTSLVIAFAIRQEATDETKKWGNFAVSYIVGFSIIKYATNCSINHRAAGMNVLITCVVHELATSLLGV